MRPFELISAQLRKASRAIGGCHVHVCSKNPAARLYLVPWRMLPFTAAICW